MTAALAQPQAAKRDSQGLQPVRFTRDLRQIADLVEICFEPRMDAGGRSAINEMRALSYFAPMVWLLAVIDRWIPGLGTGFVWRSEGRVVGNASLYRAGRHPEHGPGFLMANVAVHPDWRRRGIARALVESSLDLARRKEARWVSLEVEADNHAAKSLYQGLGFEAFETLAHWDIADTLRSSFLLPDELSPERARPRLPGEAAAEADLIYLRARRGAMAWTRPIERYDIWDGLLDGLDGLLRAAPKEHWVMEDPRNPNRLIGALWVEPSGWRHARVSLFLDPGLTDASARQGLPRAALERIAFDGWSLKLEADANDPAIESFLLERGFRKTRSLTQMRALL